MVNYAQIDSEGWVVAISQLLEVDERPGMIRLSDEECGVVSFGWRFVDGKWVEQERAEEVVEPVSEIEELREDIRELRGLLEGYVGK